MSNNIQNIQTIGTREDRGKAIAEKRWGADKKECDDNKYQVKSQSKDIFYNVTSTRNRSGNAKLS